MGVFFGGRIQAKYHIFTGVLVLDPNPAFIPSVRSVLRLLGANPAAGDEAHKEFPPTAIWGPSTSAGPALIVQVSPPWRPHIRIQNVFLRASMFCLPSQFT